MIANYASQKEQRFNRLDVKTTEWLFRNIIVDGTNCSRFESEIITEKAKEIFRIGSYEEKQTLDPGQMVWNAIAKDEPAGKPLKACEQKRIVLTHLNPQEDIEVLKKYGHKGKRQQQVARMSNEAVEQGACLTQEDLSLVLDCDVRTIRSDIKELKVRGIIVPTRGQQCDIGPGVSHKVKAVELFLCGKEPLEISKVIKHSLKSVERYVDGFCRVVYCHGRKINSLEIALITGFSIRLVNDYLDIAYRYRRKKVYWEKIEQIEERGRRYYDAVDFKKKHGLRGRRKR